MTPNPHTPGAVSEAMRAWLMDCDDNCARCSEVDHPARGSEKARCWRCIATEAQRLSDAALREREAALKLANAVIEPAQRMLYHDTMREVLGVDYAARREFDRALGAYKAALGKPAQGAPPTPPKEAT